MLILEVLLFPGGPGRVKDTKQFLADACSSLSPSQNCSPSNSAGVSGPSGQPANLHNQKRIHFQIFTAAQVDLEDAEGLTPLMHGLLAVRSSMDSESAVRAVSVLAQHSKPGSLQSQQDGVGVTTCVDKILFVFLVQLPAAAGCPPSHLAG